MKRKATTLSTSSKPAVPRRSAFYQLDNEIVPQVCAGIPSSSREWLDALTLACAGLHSKAQEDVQIFVNSVKTSIHLGYEILRTVNWHVPTDTIWGPVMKTFLSLLVVSGETSQVHNPGVVHTFHERSIEANFKPFEAVIQTNPRLCGSDRQETRKHGS
jgi:hypothetical protein